MFYRIQALPTIALAASLLFSTIVALGQRLDPAYLSQMPPPEKVLSEIKGKDPEDTVERQMGAYMILDKIIEDMAYGFEHRAYMRLKPDETRMQANYNSAYTKLYGVIKRDDHKYDHDRALFNEVLAKLFSPTFRDLYFQADAKAGAQLKANFDKMYGQPKSTSGNASGGASALSDDPTAVATRRCLELGGNAAACVGKGLGAGMMDMIGFGAKAQESMLGPGRAGVVLRGLYKNRATVSALDFREDGVSINGCGKLVDDSHNYSIEKRSGSIQITIDNEPNPIVLTMRPDGGLTGPGLIDVKGRIIVGYFTRTHYENGVATGTTSTPDYRPAMGRCVVGSLVMPPSPKAAPASAQPADDSSPIGMLTSMIGTFVPDAGEVGLRMTGKYGGGNLLLDFSGNSLVLDCGQAHVRQLYTVENTSNAMLVHVQNSVGPFTLVLQPDNSLRGSGSTTVNGRLVTGMNGDNVTFAAHSETCDVGTFRPKTGAVATTSVATAPPPPAIAASATVAPVASTPAPAGGVSMKLTIISSFPGGPNPLAGTGVTLMSERFDTLLRKVGAPIAADVTPGKAAQAYAANCFPPRSCPAYATAMQSYYVAKGAFDNAGRVVLTAPVPAGTYYVFCSAKAPNGALVWDVPAVLRVGENTITLTTGNAELIH